MLHCACFDLIVLIRFDYGALRGVPVLSFLVKFGDPLFKLFLNYREEVQAGRQIRRT